MKSPESVGTGDSVSYEAQVQRNGGNLKIDSARGEKKRQFKTSGKTKAMPKCMCKRRVLIQVTPEKIFKTSQKWKLSSLTFNF